MAGGSTTAVAGSRPRQEEVSPALLESFPEHVASLGLGPALGPHGLGQGAENVSQAGV